MKKEDESNIKNTITGKSWVNNLYQNIDINVKRTIVVGDIHGCYDELQKLLKKVDFCDNDLCISVGDVVDRGADSWKVVDFFKNTPNAYCVLGNHERRVAGVVRGTSEAAWSQLHTLSKLSKDKHNAYAKYFESLPAVIETPHAIITHARLDPNKDIRHQDPYHACGVGGESIEFLIDENAIPLWFNDWKSKYSVSKPICIGHKRYQRVELEHNKLYALDTGAVKGKLLTALILPELKIVSVVCHNYYDESLDEWKTQDFNRKYKNLHQLPLNKIFRTLDKDEHNIYEVKLIEKFKLLVKQYDFEEKTKFLRQQFMHIFGEVPADGSKKGKYFKKIHALLDSNVSERLVNFILSGKSYQFSKLSSIYQKKTLEDIIKDYLKIDKWLKTLKPKK